MTAGFATERYDAAHHDITGFSCGNELLDRWLARYAGQSQRRDAARTFVATTSARKVYGYYTLLAGQLDHHEATPETSRGLSRHFPIPSRSWPAWPSTSISRVAGWERPSSTTP